jgi:polyphosphate kinase
MPGPVYLSPKQYETEMLRLQTELVYMQEWIVASGQRLVVVFEGRDTAGKDGVACARARPAWESRRRDTCAGLRNATMRLMMGDVALEVPLQKPKTRSTPTGRSPLHTAGSTAAGTTAPTEAEYEEFLRFCPFFEQALQNDGMILIKYWLSVSDEEQERRFKKRLSDPRKRWKFSSIDLQGRARWVDYAEAKDRMFNYTDTESSPWYVVEADDKRAARLNLISHLLSVVPYEHLDKARPVKLPPRQERRYLRPPKATERLVPARYTVGAG